MTARTYPYNGWVLMPSFKPKLLEFVQRYNSYGDYDGDLSKGGKFYFATDIFPTQEEAISAGWAKVRRAQDDITKRTNGVIAKSAALTAAYVKLVKEKL